MKMTLDQLRVDSYATQVNESELTEIKGGTWIFCWGSRKRLGLYHGGSLDDHGGNTYGIPGGPSCYAGCVDAPSLPSMQSANNGELKEDNQTQFTGD
ncbi:hypothetical protein [Tenacibaculum ovolyticum]|uniref:hypothetical protein n=1 Tax=Tenacibaculum ovolyticum TaxID=104270 RepID=UPI003BACAF2A